MNIENILKTHKLKITAERKVLYTFMRKIHIFQASDLQQQFKDIGRASIFRTINTFLEIGIIRKIDIGKNAETYELSEANNHHEHIKCQLCGKIEPFKIPDICKKIISEAEKKGFSVKNHSVNIIGECKNCL